MWFTVILMVLRLYLQVSRPQISRYFIDCENKGRTAFKDAHPSIFHFLCQTLNLERDVISWPKSSTNWVCGYPTQKMLGTSHIMFEVRETRARTFSREIFSDHWAGYLQSGNSSGFFLGSYCRPCQPLAYCQKRAIDAENRPTRSRDIPDWSCKRMTMSLSCTSLALKVCVKCLTWNVSCYKLHLKSGVITFTVTRVMAITKGVSPYYCY